MKKIKAKINTRPKKLLKKILKNYLIVDTYS